MKKLLALLMVLNISFAASNAMLVIFPDKMIKKKFHKIKKEDMKKFLIPFYPITIMQILL